MGLICVVGGKSIDKDIRGFRSNPPPDIVVATPGRLNDHLENHKLAQAMSGLKYLIFDEADQARDGLKCSRSRSYVELVKFLLSRGKVWLRRSLECIFAPRFVIFSYFSLCFVTNTLMITYFITLITLISTH